MTELLIHNEKIDSIFQLLGKNEDDISYSVGYTFANCKVYLENFLAKLELESKCDISRATIRLQEYERKKGFIDFEIIIPSEIHLIIEAKKGWIFPSSNQLEKYESRDT